MKRKILRLLELILAAALLISFVMIYRTQREYAQGTATYAEAAELAQLPPLYAAPKITMAASPDAAVPAAEDRNLDLLAHLDLDGLRAQNPDVLGWITIPGTVLSYPLLQRGDNDYYLQHTWQNAGSSVGAIFMDYRNDAALSDFHTLIYGHRMRDGSMFASLKDYKSLEHWAEHPCVYLACTGGVYRYDIFAAYEASVLGHVYHLDFADAAGREAFIASCLAQSVIDTGIVPSAEEQILTLSTCTGSGHKTRWVVQAVLAECVLAGQE